MPIQPYLGRQSFDPELIEAMGEAFVMCCDYFKLQPTASDPMVGRIAQCVIDAAKNGASDVEGLFEGAMKQMDTKLD